MVFVLIALCVAVGLASAEETVTVKGKAVKVDARAGTLIVSKGQKAGAEKQESTFRIVADTKIVRDGNTIRLEQVESRDMVALSVGVSKDA